MISLHRSSARLVLQRLPHSGVPGAGCMAAEEGIVRDEGGGGDIGDYLIDFNLREYH